MQLKLQDLNKTQLILLIISTNLILRSFFFFSLDADSLVYSDQTKYIGISEALLNNFNFKSHHIIQRVPLYPFFIFLIRSIIDNLLFVVLIQNLLGILSLYLIYNTCKIIDKRISILATLIYSFNLNIILYQNLIMTEAIFASFFVLSIFFLLKFLKKKNLKFLIYLTISLAISALIRPQLYYIFYLMFVIIFFLLNKSIKEKIKFFLIFTIIFKSFLFIWEYRNYKVHGEKFFIIAKEINLIGYYLPHYDQYEYKINLEEAKKIRKIKWENYINEFKKDNVNQDSLMFRENLAVEYAFEELRKYQLLNIIRANLAGSLKTIFAPSFVDIGYYYKLKKISFSSTAGTSFLDQSLNFIKIVYETNLKYFLFLFFSSIFLILLRVVQIYGFIILFKKNFKISILILLIIFFFLILLGPLGAPKYRIPFEFFFSIYLSYGVFGLVNLIKKRLN